jgi:hypothetical protein
MTSTLGTIFLALGLAFGVVALVLWLLRRNWVARAGRAQGEVIDLVKRSRTVTNYVPVVRFRTEAGQETTFRGFIGSRPPAHRKGDIVKVLYDPANPSRAMVDSVMVVWLLPIIFAANAVPWLIAAVVLLTVA